MKKSFPPISEFCSDNVKMDFNNTVHPLDTALGRAVMINVINQMKPKADRVAPDKRGCETIFAKAFLTDDMRWDFPLIARDFIKHEAANIEKYKDLLQYLFKTYYDSRDSLHGKGVRCEAKGRLRCTLSVVRRVRHAGSYLFQ